MTKLFCQNCNYTDGPFRVYRFQCYIDNKGVEVTEGLAVRDDEQNLYLCPNCGLAAPADAFLTREEEVVDDREATTEEINEAVKSYCEEMLVQSGKPFDGRLDAPQVQMALALRGLQARTTAILESALRQKFC